MFSKEVESKLARMVFTLNLLSDDQRSECIKMVQSSEGPEAFSTLILQQGYLPQETVLRLVAMIQGSKIKCLKCDQVHEGSNFEEPDDFVCQNCGLSLEVQEQMMPAMQTMAVTPGKDEAQIEEGSFDPSQFIGRNIAGVEISKFLGQGSMGLVFKGYQATHDRQVAVKIISPSVAQSKEFINRFQREALSGLQISHPHIIDVYGGGEDLGHKYILMEYVEGKNLQDILDEKGTLSQEEALKIVAQIGKGLMEAHSQYILHRDIKPENIFIDTNNRAKLGDFGVAKNFSQADLTQAGTLLGTPHYMSPEQVEGKELDFRADLYCLGATLYHMLFASPPFSGDSTVTIMYKQVNEPISFPSDKKDQVAPAVRKLIQWMMSKEKWRRPSSSEELVNEVIRIYKELKQGQNPTFSRSTTSSGSKLPPPPKEKVASTVDRPSPMTTPSGRVTLNPGTTGSSDSQWKLWAVAGLLTVLLLGVVGFLGYQIWKDSQPKSKDNKDLASTKNPDKEKIEKDKDGKKEDEKKGDKKDNPPLTSTGPSIAVFKKISTFRRRKQYEKALGLINNQLLQFPKNEALRELDKKITAEKKEYDKKERALQENLRAAENLYRQGNYDFGRISWMISQFEKAAEFYPLKSDSYRAKIKKLLQEGVRQALKEEKFLLYKSFYSKLKNLKSSDKDYAQYWLEYRMERLAKKEQDLKKEIRKRLAPLELQAQNASKKEKKLALQQKQIQLLQSYFQTLEALYKREMRLVQTRRQSIPYADFKDSYRNISNYFGQVRDKLANLSNLEAEALRALRN